MDFCTQHVFLGFYKKKKINYFFVMGLQPTTTSQCPPGGETIYFIQTLCPIQNNKDRTTSNDSVYVCSPNVVRKSAYEVYAWCNLKPDHHTLWKKIMYDMMYDIDSGLGGFFQSDTHISFPGILYLSFPFYPVTIFHFPSLNLVTCWPPKFKATSFSAVVSLILHPFAAFAGVKASKITFPYPISFI